MARAGHAIRAINESSPSVVAATSTSCGKWPRGQKDRTGFLYFNRRIGGCILVGSFIDYERLATFEFGRRTGINKRIGRRIKERTPFARQCPSASNQRTTWSESRKSGISLAIVSFNLTNNVCHPKNQKASQPKCARTSARVFSSGHTPYPFTNRSRRRESRQPGSH